MPFKICETLHAAACSDLQKFLSYMQQFFEPQIFKIAVGNSFLGCRFSTMVSAVVFGGKNFPRRVWLLFLVGKVF
jgi:hypothetical protein